MGYAAGTLAQVAVFNDTPNGWRGGIWQSGGGLSADSNGDIFLQTGNGTFDANTGGVLHPDRDDVIKRVTGSAYGFFSSPAYFNNAVYYSGKKGFLGRYSLTDGLLSRTPASHSPTKFNLGSTPSISAHGLTNGIVWAIGQGSKQGVTAVLHAYDARDVSRELYNSQQKATRETLGPGTHFSVPTVTGGRVYVGTQSNLVVYGLL
jgi:hypothetical protein